MRFLFLISLIFFIGIGCLEKFNPQIPNPSNVLVVEGHLSDRREPDRVKLSRTRAIGNPLSVAEQNARVVVIDGSGREHVFGEVAPGVYESAKSDFQGVVGEIYMLDIVTRDGRHYRSDPVRFKKTPPIEEVYYEEASKVQLGELDQSGISVFLDTYDPTGNTRYYRWEWLENWEIKMPINSKYDFQVFKDTVGMGYPIPKALRVDVCYDTDTTRKIMVASTKLLREDRVSRFELTFVSTDGFKLESIYGIIVYQYALDEAGHAYWDELRAASEGQGTLFDPQPYELTGNVRNVDDPDEPVLGYFDASTVTVNSLVVIRDQLEDLFFPLNQCFLERDTVPYRLVTEYLQSGYLIDTVGPFGSTYVIMAPIDCADCRLYGTLERPKFRPD